MSLLQITNPTIPSPVDAESLFPRCLSVHDAPVNPIAIASYLIGMEGNDLATILDSLNDLRWADLDYSREVAAQVSEFYALARGDHVK